MLINLLLWLYTKTNKKTEKKTDGETLERANIATATKQQPRLTLKSDRIHTVRKPADG